MSEWDAYLEKCKSVSDLILLKTVINCFNI